MIFRYGLFAALTCAVCAGALAQAEDASYRVRTRAADEHGIRPLDGADGATAFFIRGGKRALSNKPDSAPPSAFLYFDVNDAIAKDLTGPLYVEIEYYDAAPGCVLQLQYQSDAGDDLNGRYHPSDNQWGGWLTGREQWRRVIFQLDRPLFKNGQNLGADFRLSGGPMSLKSVRVTRTKPDGCEKLDAFRPSDLRARVHIGRGGELIVGGFDPARKEDVPQQTRALEAAVPLLKSAGVTSHEGYVRWNLCETTPGQYDWSVYDAFVDLYKKCQLKWVPFLIVGSPYSLPDWYYKKPGSQGYVCLEHGQESDVQSLWNPVLREHVARFIKAFCDHYRDSGVIESILLGVTGNYGEAIYVASGNDWTADIHGPYHTHAGIWAGDQYAVEDFRAWLQRKYATADALNKTWTTTHADFAAVKPFLRKDAPCDRAWLDFCDWYIGSMTDYSRFWLRETRKNFPGEIYLCTGGHAPAEHGADFGIQCKIAAEINGGVRITNEGSDYRANFSLTRWVASAGRQYGAYFSFEPAGEVKPEAVSARVFGATTSGAHGLHYYFPNLFAAPAATDNFIRWGKQFKQRTPVEEIAVYYPETFIKLNGANFLGLTQPLRDRFDFDFMSDEQIRDGGLQRIKALILLAGNVSEADLWGKIADWVHNGGLILYADGIGPLRSVEGDEQFHEAFFGKSANLGKGRAAVFSGPNDKEGYRAFLAQQLATSPELSKATHCMLTLDGAEDNVFASAISPNELLWLNATDKEVRKGHKRLPPRSVITQKVH